MKILVITASIFLSKNYPARKRGLPSTSTRDERHSAPFQRGSWLVSASRVGSSHALTSMERQCSRSLCDTLRWLNRTRRLSEGCWLASEGVPCARYFTHAMATRRSSADHWADRWLFMCLASVVPMRSSTTCSGDSGLNGALSVAVDDMDSSPDMEFVFFRFKENVSIL
jgi:hypothetical protein